jgi:hypothetical protein
MSLEDYDFLVSNSSLFMPALSVSSARYVFIFSNSRSRSAEVVEMLALEISILRIVLVKHLSGISCSVAVGDGVNH